MELTMSQRHAVTKKMVRCVGWVGRKLAHVRRDPHAVDTL